MNSDKIFLDHGSGGKVSHGLISDIMLPIFDNAVLSQLNDGAILDIEGKHFAFSTDTYVVDPIFFPGGDIGSLAINGTVNDLSMCGSMPLYVSSGLVIEEGFPMEDLKKILRSMNAAARKAGVKVVTGDTKVVPIGVADKIFVNTSGIGRIPEGVNVSCDRACPGDKVILSGSIADHGVTILAQREEMRFNSPVVSDTAPLNQMVQRMFNACQDIHVLRDPTRGGVGTALNEIAEKSNVGIKVYETQIPLKDEVSGICEILGFDPLYVANEGKLLAFVGDDHAEEVLAAVKQDTFGKDASIIGEVVADNPRKVFMETLIGGTRIVDMLTGEQLPRIC
jgi:hydrogenase expression/formation protein HypE